MLIFSHQWGETGSNRVVKGTQEIQLWPKPPPTVSQQRSHGWTRLLDTATGSAWRYGNRAAGSRDQEERQRAYLSLSLSSKTMHWKTYNIIYYTVLSYVSWDIGRVAALEQFYAEYCACVTHMLLEILNTMNSHFDSISFLWDILAFQRNRHKTFSAFIHQGIDLNCGCIMPMNYHKL